MTNLSAFTNSPPFARTAALAGDTRNTPSEGHSARQDVFEPDAWAPAWEPAIGQRVRVRLSPECRREWPKGSLAGYLGVGGHWLCQDGTTGIVVQILTGDDHPYVVHSDQELTMGGTTMRRACQYARPELEPADWAGPGERED